MFEMLAQLVGEAVVGLLGWLLHKKLDWPPRRARMAGEFILIGALTAVGLYLSLRYS